jgi:hypothetical protein
MPPFTTDSSGKVIFIKKRVSQAPEPTVSDYAIKAMERESRIQKLRAINLSGLNQGFKMPASPTRSELSIYEIPV